MELVELRKIPREELEEILEKHKKWLNNEDGGERSNLRYCDLSHYDLRNKDMRYCDLHGSRLVDIDMRGTDLRGSNMRYCDIRGGILVGADMRYCDLSGCNLDACNIDFSCLPLWPKALNAQFDNEQILMILYHAVRTGIQSKNVSDELKEELYKIAYLANKSHRVEECGEIEIPEKMKGENK